MLWHKRYFQKSRIERNFDHNIMTCFPCLLSAQRPHSSALWTEFRSLARTSFLGAWQVHNMRVSHVCQTITIESCHR
ncbi:hypothetical protein A0H81_03089 [Grifola frondosa]|uniref:Uncharacterized protein n=1 Tax=Grifola frondosa TaxID=5627 RepID=A0A1C7MHV3_GRIFR|nr:hypothetical protein A0H81_03089 [Grifola frondosa]